MNDFLSRYPWSQCSWTQEQIEAYRLSMDQFTAPLGSYTPILATHVIETTTDNGKYNTKVEATGNSTSITISPTSPSHPAADAELIRTRSDDGSVTIVITPKG